MPNDLTGLIDNVIMPQALVVLRENCVMPSLVKSNFSGEVSKKGDTVDFPLPQNMGEAGVFDPSVGGTSTDLGSATVPVKLDTWLYKQFQLNDKEYETTMTTGSLPSAADAAVKSIANKIGTMLLNLYKDIPYHAGTALTTPSTSADITSGRKVLQKNLVPPELRRFVMDVEAEAKLLNLYSKANETGSTEALRAASLGRLFGFDTYSDQLMPEHIAGTAGVTTAINGAVAAGAVVMNLDGAGAATTLKDGDLFTVAGVTGYQGVIVGDHTADGTGAFTGVTFYPAAPTGGFSDNAVLTLPGNHTPNLMFHTEAFGLALRPLSAVVPVGSTISVQSDPVSGIPLRLEAWRDSNKATNYFKFDLLAGVGTLRPELAARLLG